MRGKLFEQQRLNNKLRLIPAGAGKTRALPYAPGDSAAHPRRCGENGKTNFIISASNGSSPQVRGKPSPGRWRRAIQRLIPAGAGKTCNVYIAIRSHPAHPRRCGENSVAEPVSPKMSGSSPQVRGKRVESGRSRKHSRLIPAGAGKTTFRTVSRDKPTAHPRRCGENSTTWQGQRGLRGSSPQVRGKRLNALNHEEAPRLIPAGAGKTTFLRKPSNHPAAHPRRCGENAYGG